MTTALIRSQPGSAAAAALVLLAAVASVQPVRSATIAAVRTNQARYEPGVPVQFAVNLQGDGAPGRELAIRYYHLGELVGVDSQPAPGNGVFWTWQPPADDFSGYLAEIDLVENGEVVQQSTMAVDVSSDWTRFPRYGFVSKYDQNVNVSTVMDGLNRRHINGVQFYDWANKHHQPLAGTPDNPAPSWADIANRTNQRSTVSAYIANAHQYNMAAMSYNLAYGALDDAGAAADGVLPQWYLYKDAIHGQKDRHDLPAGWLSDVYLTDPNNPAWRQYIAANTAEAFEVFDFDGWHIDQLGGRGAVYDYNGQAVDLNESFGGFIDAMRAHPSLHGKDMAFNAVNQYGQASIAASDVGFLYTEVWAPNDHYNDLATIILQNNAHGNGRLNSVLAAYVNYDLSGSQGSFNTPAVLLTDAVIFAFGGAHLELGEHMLSHEYFPVSNLQASNDLQTRLTSYYDFLVGYQNLLRDGGQFSDNPLASTNTPLKMWPAVQGTVAAVNKVVGGREVFQLINFADAAHMNWRDNSGNQAAPQLIENMQLSFFSHKRVGRVWAASPDIAGGAPQVVPFTQSATGQVELALPSLEYWTMLVAEPEATGWDDAADPAYANSWTNGSNGGTGFGPWQLFASNTAGGFAGFWRPDEAAGDHGVDNAGAIDRDGGAAWASFANKGGGVDKATAYRAFDEPLANAGDRFSATFENGAVEGRLGISLRSDNLATTADDYAAGARMQFFFQGGGDNYSLLDGDGLFDTGIGWTPFGLKVEVTLRSAETYDLLVWRYDEPEDRSPDLFIFEDRTLAGAGAIDSVSVFQYDAAGGGIQDDLLLNHLSYFIAEASGLAGDFDGDGDADGGDFLLWQRGMSPQPHSHDDLVAWAKDYGIGRGSQAASRTVAEPGSVCLLCTFAVLARWRQASAAER